ncbi:hypothetical protein [Rhodanobacter sp. FW106-PBR-R2A-1-13]|uniref:hypothetical protein n=1 Tax=Rhodanobacter sp. FW106-PBR-R2A-1-13 TaxID=3454845 RepID=UPI0034E3AEA3
MSHPDHHPQSLASILEEVIRALESDGDEHGCATRLRTARAMAVDQESARADQHDDDRSVDQFARAMKAKLATARAKGRGGWQNEEASMHQRLSDMLRHHVDKGDPVDVANFCMFLHQRCEGIAPVR